MSRRKCCEMSWNLLRNSMRSDGLTWYVMKYQIMKLHTMFTTLYDIIHCISYDSSYNDIGWHDITWPEISWEYNLIQITFARHNSEKHSCYRKSIFASFRESYHNTDKDLCHITRWHAMNITFDVIFFAIFKWSAPFERLVKISQISQNWQQKVWKILDTTWYNAVAIQYSCSVGIFWLIIISLGPHTEILNWFIRFVLECT